MGEGHLIESWTEHPSTQDLILTTGIGWIIGELRHQLKIRIKDKKELVFLVDPIWTTLDHFDLKLTKQNSEAVVVFGLKYEL